MIAEVESSNKPPYVWNINIDGLDDIRLNETFDQTLQRLRSRVSDDYFRLDIHKTILATVENAGMVDFRFQQQTRPPEYLLLIDRNSIANHRAHLFNYLYQKMRENEVHVERFYYRSDMKIVWNEKFPDGIPLKDIQTQYATSRLLIMGNGYQLLSPTGKLARWSTIFNKWKERSILTPKSLKTWGQRERQLEQSFIVLPASLQGLNFLIEQLDAGEDADPESWRSRIVDAQMEDIDLGDSLIESLLQHFSLPVFNWIAACAVYPNLHWDLTRYLGQKLSTPEDPLLTIENLAELNSLPWFVQGNIPKTARVLLLNYLEREQPATLFQTRQYLHELLQNNQPPKDSAAWEDQRMTMALNEWLFTMDGARKKILEKDIASLMSTGIEPDFTVVKYLQRARSPLDFIVPNSWKKYLHHQGYPALGLKKFWKDLFHWALPLWLALGALCWWLPINIQICEGESSPYLIDDVEKNLCIETLADRILLNEHLARAYIENGDFEFVDSLTSWGADTISAYLAQDSLKSYQIIHLATAGIKDTLASRTVHLGTQDAGMGLLSLSRIQVIKAAKNYYHHLSADYYNLGAKLYPLLESHNAQDSVYKNIQDSICYYFTKAYELDTTNAKVRFAYAWCQDTSNQIITIVTKVIDRESRQPLANVLVKLSDGRTFNTNQTGEFTFNILNDYTNELSFDFFLTGYQPFSFSSFDSSLSLPIIELQKTLPPIEVNRPVITDNKGVKYGEFTFYQSNTNKDQFYYGPRPEMAYFDNGLPKVAFIVRKDCNGAENVPLEILFYAKYNIGIQSEAYREAFEILLEENPGAQVLGPVSSELLLSVSSNLNSFEELSKNQVLDLNELLEFGILGRIDQADYISLFLEEESNKFIHPINISLESTDDGYYYLPNSFGQNDLVAQPYLFGPKIITVDRKSIYREL